MPVMHIIECFFRGLGLSPMPAKASDPAVSSDTVSDTVIERLTASLSKARLGQDKVRIACYLARVALETSVVVQNRAGGVPEACQWAPGIPRYALKMLTTPSIFVAHRAFTTASLSPRHLDS